jgi:flagellar hook-length control protein FliK
MAVSQTLLSSIDAGRPAVMGAAPISDESLDGADFSTFFADAARTQIEVGTPQPPGEGEAGVLPDTTGKPLPVAVVGADQVPDRSLEEFAVGMGIDRSLARLLLQETAEPADAGRSADLPADLSADESTSDESATDERLTAQSDASSSLFPFTLAVGTPTPAVVLQAPTVQLKKLSPPIGDEDVLSLAQANLMLRSMMNAGSAVPGRASASSTAHELRWRGAANYAPLVAPAESATASVDASLGRGVLPQVQPSLPEAVAKSPGRTAFAADVSVEGAVSAAAPQRADGRRVEGLDFVVESRVVVGAENLATSPQAALSTPYNPAANLPTWDVTRVVLPESNEVERAPASSPTLAVPSAEQAPGDRVRAFADAVAQRLLGQVKSETWNVRLALEPQNLGAMNIELTLNGKDLAANIGVANTEVRVLLEAGLPRLREALESSGLNLTQWSFAQHGANSNRNSSAERSSARLSRVLTEEGVDRNIDDASMMPRRIDNANRVLDMFV